MIFALASRPSSEFISCCISAWEVKRSRCGGAAVRRCGGAAVRRCSARWLEGAQADPRACATWGSRARPKPDTRGALRLARAGLAVQAGSGARCVSPGPGRAGVQRGALCLACAAAIFSWRAAGLLRSSAISGLSAIACCSIGFPWRLAARPAMSMPSPPGWPKAVTSAGSDIGEAALPRHPSGRALLSGPKAATSKRVGLWSGGWWRGLLRALGPCCDTAHHVLHQAGHVGLRTASLGGAGLLAHRAHAHASRPQLRASGRHQKAAREQSQHRVRVLSCLSSTSGEGKSSQNMSAPHVYMSRTRAFVCAW
jgi:hypothetical protein